MPISYTKRGWTNNSPPAINAANLGAMDDGIKQACDGVDALNVAPVAHATSHKHGGSDEIATATPSANAIPKADSSGKLDSWISNASTTVNGKVQLATDGNTDAGKAVQANDSRLPIVGTFTPTVIAIDGGEATYTTQYGQYVKIGKLVHVDIHLNFNKNTLSGGIRISGLPYISKSATLYRASANIPYHQGINVNANYQNIGGYITYGSPNIILVQNSFTNNTVLITDTNLSASSVIIVSADYVID